MSVPTEPKVRTALVTGAAGTMGRAATQGLLADGVRVAMADINLEALENVRRELVEGTAADQTYTIAFDISDPQACSTAVEKITREFGPIDTLVNNAGILSNNKIAETTPEEWRGEPGRCLLPQQGLPAGNEGEEMGADHQRLFLRS
jgi:3-oxoacyl-[acyl-carrier protein] reductase